MNRYGVVFVQHATHRGHVLERITQVASTAIVAAVAIAFGLAFGLGGQDTARRWLARGESTVSTAADQIDPQQVKEQARAAAQMQEDQMRTQPRSRTR